MRIRQSQYGVLHAWKSNLRNKRFRRARDTRAILWVPVLACASMAARAASPAHSPHCGECAGHLFASQLQRTAEKRYTQVSRKSRSRATSTGAEDGRPLSSSAHARTTQDPVRACHGSHLPAALGPHCSNTHQSLQLSPSAR